MSGHKPFRELAARVTRPPRVARESMNIAASPKSRGLYRLREQRGLTR